ncbi:unnamed protein product [Amoebophrya sp. A25]|nr:unnamed protein product [Amoebophrya sp. A25]|eukprot:GSA25T00007006001.1
MISALSCPPRGRAPRSSLTLVLLFLASFTAPQRHAVQLGYQFHLDASSSTSATTKKGDSPNVAVALGTFKSMLDQYVMKYKANKMSYERERRLNKRQLELKRQLKDPHGLETALTFQRKEREQFVSDQSMYASTIGTLVAACEHLDPKWAEDENSAALGDDIKAILHDHETRTYYEAP